MSLCEDALVRYFALDYVVGPNGGGKTTLFRAGMIWWNKEIRLTL